MCTAYQSKIKIIKIKKGENNMKEKMNLMKLCEDMMKDVKAGYKYYADLTGHLCGCGCYYFGSGGSDTAINGAANLTEGLKSPQQ
jgi:hypothetical protein